ncbi:MAG: TlpA disulfide reductase family protein [Microthrixaceae bacterium]
MTEPKRGANPYEDISKRTTDHHPKLGLMIGGAVAAVVAIIAAVVIFWPSGDDPADAASGTGAEAASNASQQNATVTISGEDLPPMPDSGGLLADPAEDPANGLVVPTLTGESFDESEVVIGAADGEPKMVVFLAHWCPHCQAEVPAIQQWIDSGGLPEGLEVYSVATGQDASQPNYPPSNWLASESWSPKVLLDDEAQSAAASWGLTGYPYFVMVDADGKVWQRGSGEIPIEEIDRLAQELVAGEAPTADDSSNDGLQTPVDLESGDSGSN